MRAVYRGDDQYNFAAVLHSIHKALCVVAIAMSCKQNILRQ